MQSRTVTSGRLFRMRLCPPATMRSQRVAVALLTFAAVCVWLALSTWRGEDNKLGFESAAVASLAPSEIEEGLRRLQDNHDVVSNITSNDITSNDNTVAAEDIATDDSTSETAHQESVQVATVPPTSDSGDLELAAQENHCSPTNEAIRASALPVEKQYAVSAVVLTQNDARQPHQPVLYEFTIRPLPVFGCTRTCRKFPVCSTFSFFEAVIIGPNIVLDGNIINPLEDDDPVWTVQIQVPPGVPGTYTIKAQIVFQDFSQVFDDFQTRQAFLSLIKKPTFRATYPAVMLYKTLPMTNHTSNFQVPEALVGNHDKYQGYRAALPWCSELRPSTLRGFWDDRFTNYFPFDCRIMALRQTQKEGGEHVQTLRNAFHHKWISSFGDSNMRGLFYHLCELLRATGYHKEPKGDMGKGDRLHACFSNAGDTKYLITERIWWPSLYPLLHDFLKLPAQKILIDAGLNQSHSIPVEFRSRTRPDMTILSMGSHDFHMVNKQGAQVRDFVLKGAPYLLESSENGRHLLFVEVTPTNPLKIPPDVTNADISFLMQNNPRAMRINDAARKAFPPPLIHVDAYAITNAPYLLGAMSDAVHLRSSVYDVVAEIIANYLVRVPLIENP